MNKISQLLPPNKISVSASKVIQRLCSAGHLAYLVGGSVRDILLNRDPKDFDVATDAEPEEIRNLFRNSREVGRRFRIVHIRFGREIIEVSTFRGHHKGPAAEDSGPVMDDNVYGSFEEDVLRRDFTINALYYDLINNEILDLVGGMTDIENRAIRIIGDPIKRFREDPVRMLRAIRFKAKLDFNLADNVTEEIRRSGQLLEQIPAARLFEETLKLFMSGHAAKSFVALTEYGLFNWLFPCVENHFSHYNTQQRLIELALNSTDSRIRAGLPVTPAFVLAAFLWSEFLHQKDLLQEGGMASADAIAQAGLRTLTEQQLSTSIPKRFAIPMREIWSLQFRLPIRRGKRAEKVRSHKRFRAAYDFLILREESGEKLDNLGKWWTHYQEAKEEQKEALRTTAYKRVTKRPRAKKTSNN